MRRCRIRRQGSSFKARLRLVARRRPEPNRRLPLRRGHQMRMPPCRHGLPRTLRRFDCLASSRHPNFSAPVWLRPPTRRRNYPRRPQTPPRHDLSCPTSPNPRLTITVLRGLASRSPRHAMRPPSGLPRPRPRAGKQSSEQRSRGPSRPPSQPTHGQRRRYSRLACRAAGDGFRQGSPATQDTVRRYRRPDPGEQPSGCS